MPRTTNPIAGSKANEPEPEFDPRDYVEAIDVTSHDQPPNSASIPGLAEPAVKPYEKKRWKGVIDVYQCSTCKHCENEQDNMILHVLKHVPANEREQLFERLMKEK